MEKIKYEEVNIRNIQESEINAQQLNEKDFKRLVENIKKDGYLSSCVLLMKKNNSDKLICISGHHRIKACKKAGLNIVPSLVIDEVDESTRYRLQLSHNDINGTSDKDLLMIMYDKLINEDLFLVKELDNFTPNKFENIDIDSDIFYHTILALKEDNHEKLSKMLDEININDYENKVLMDKEDYFRLKTVLTKAHKKGFKTPGTTFVEMLNKETF